MEQEGSLEEQFTASTPLPEEGELEKFKMSWKEYLVCRMDKDGFYHCTVYNKYENVGIPVRKIGYFDDIVKDFSLPEVGNDPEEGMINVYPRMYSVVTCTPKVIDGRRILVCDQEPKRRIPS